MTSIQRTDLLQVTARKCGTVLLSLTMSGASTLNDVFRQVRESTPSDAGMVTISLRNRTQGWTQQHNIVFRQSSTTVDSKSRTGGRRIDEYPSLFA